jgi:hypothetical protein
VKPIPEVVKYVLESPFFQTMHFATDTDSYFSIGYGHIIDGEAGVRVVICLEHHVSELFLVEQYPILTTDVCFRSGRQNDVYSFHDSDVS